MTQAPVTKEDRAAALVAEYEKHAPCENWTSAEYERAILTDFARYLLGGGAVAQITEERRWRPIETAPKDVKIIAAWQCSHSGIMQVSGDVRNILGHWVSDADGMIYPILWMPLPAPPALAASSSREG